MKAKLSAFLFLFFLICYSQNDNNEDELKNLRASYMSYLTAEGYMPSMDDDLDIKFKSEGTTYYIIVKPGDSFTLSRIFANSDGCQERITKSLNRLNSRYRNITAFHSEDNCKSVTIECNSWLKDKDDWKGKVFKFSLSSLKNAEASVGEYLEEFKN